MRRLAPKESPTAKVNEEKLLLTTYRCLFGTTPLILGLHPGELWVGRGGSIYTDVPGDRLVLVGDALCKHTPNVGNGYNGGVQDLVVLATELYRLLHGLPKRHVVNPDGIKAVFEEFQRVPEKESHKLQQRSPTLTRLQACAT
ncbi:hypothetical protein DL769_002489 [Monosporascus sp. CRB-8-3]|nr:hypothetical protein DL769_002489 [Monosporascus sp. CRB-8-3]